MRVQFVVTGPKGTPDVSHVATIGPEGVGPVEAGADPAADLVVTASRADLAAVAAGEARQDALFMQGRLKVVGRMGDYLSLIPLHGTDEYRALLGSIST